MTLKVIRDWLKPQIAGLNTAFIGRTDPTKEKVICIYPLSTSTDLPAIGGNDNKSYRTKGIRILIGWSKNCDTSEQVAQSIYDIFNGQSATIDGKDVFFKMKTDEPVGVGANDHDIYEFVINLEMTIKEG